MLSQLVQREADRLCSALQPTLYSNHQREQIADFVQRLACKHGEAHFVLLSGSSCTRTYLPDGDIDLVILSPFALLALQQSQAGNGWIEEQQQQDQVLLSELFLLFFQEIYRREQEQRQLLLLYHSVGHTSAVNHHSHDYFMIRNIEFINARTKLLHCVINNISVDVTVNQLAVLLSILYLEEIDKIIGDHHLFKRSLALVKVCCVIIDSIDSVGGVDSREYTVDYVSGEILTSLTIVTQIYILSPYTLLHYITLYYLILIYYCTI
jgi:hypothetical protein